MFNLISTNPLAFILALLIGIATGWWIWARREVAGEEEHQTFTPPPEPEPDPEPGLPPEPVAPPADGPGPRIAAAVGESEDLTLINGIGPKLAALCNDLGVRRFDQIAAWGAEDVAEVDAHLGSFTGRISRDQWVEQAKLLAAGRMQDWQGRFGYKGQRD